MSSGVRTGDHDLGEILLTTHLIEQEALAKARAECQKTSRPLWRLLTRDGRVSEDALFKALQKEVRVPVLAADQLKSVVVPEEMRAALPHDVAQHLGILPLERSTDGKRAVMAMVDPTADITPIWPALTKLGVIEVRRFLVHLGTLRLGLEFFYGQPWQPEPANAEDVEAAVQATLARSAITNRIPASAAAHEASIDAAPGDSTPLLKAVHLQQGAIHTEPSMPMARSGTSLRPVAPMPEPVRPQGVPAAALSSGEVRELSVLPELEDSDLLVVDDAPRLDSRTMVPEHEPVQDALITASESLLIMMQLELGTTRPEALARLARSVAERLGFASRGVRELMLVARFFSLLRRDLLRQGKLPPLRKDMLGFEVSHPLQNALRELQTVFVDFIRLSTEPDIVPMGTRILEAVIAALDLIETHPPEELSSEALGEKLQKLKVEHEILSAIVQVVETDLSALGIQPGQREEIRSRPEIDGPAAPVVAPVPVAPPVQDAPVVEAAPPVPVEPVMPLPAAEPLVKLLVVAPLEPVMPAVGWKTTPVDSLPDEGLTPYSAEETRSA